MIIYLGPSQYFKKTGDYGLLSGKEVKIKLLTKWRNEDRRLLKNFSYVKAEKQRPAAVLRLSVKTLKLTRGG